MKKIIFIIATLSCGGAERVVSNISLNISNDIEKEIIIFGENSEVTYPYKGEIICLDKIKNKNILLKIYAFLFRIHKINEIKKNNNKDVSIISFLEYSNLLNVITKNRKKIYISVRNHMSTKYNNGIKSKFWNYTIKHLYPKADKIIAVSKEIKNDLVKTYGVNESKIKVIYNSYPIEEINILASEEIDEKYKYIFDNPVIITSGRLNKQKGQWHLIRAFSEIKKEISNAKLVILGRGELELELKKLATDLNIINDVHFLGFQQNPFKYISKSQVFVMTSFHEGFPNALAEAMACGVPIISTDCLSGPREILAPNEFEEKNINYDLNINRYGILIPVCDGIKYEYQSPLTKEEKMISKSIKILFEDEKLRKYYSNQSLKRIKDFDIKNIIKEWENII